MARGRPDPKVISQESLPEKNILRDEVLESPPSDVDHGIIKDWDNESRIRLNAVLTSTITKDLNITTNQINIGTQLLSAGIVLSEIPSNIIMQRIGPRVWLSGQLFAWGLVATFQAFIQSYPAYLVTRILLGLCEGGFIPGALYYLSTWYKKDETSFRTTLFFYGQMFASATSSLISAGLLRLSGTGGLEGWRWIFLVEGLITIFVGIVFTLFVPPAAGDGRALIGMGRWSYFSERETQIIRNRVLLDDPRKARGQIQISRSDIWKTVCQPRILQHAFLTLVSMSAFQGLTQYTPSLIKSLGFGAVRANALASVPVYCGIVWLSVLAYISDRVGHRGPFVLLAITWNVISYACLRASTYSTSAWHQYGVIAVANVSYCSMHILNVGWLSVYCTTPQERSVAMALIVMAANCAGISGSQIFRTSDAPKYLHGLTAICALAGVSWVLALVLGVQYYISRKKALVVDSEANREDKSHGTVASPPVYPPVPREPGHHEYTRPSLRSLLTHQTTVRRWSALLALHPWGPGATTATCITLPRTVISITDPNDRSDGDPLALSSLTPDDDEEFIATLFPHPFPKHNGITLSLSRSPLSTNPHLRSEEDRSLFNHYLQVVAGALSRSHSDRNPFLVTLLPLAATSNTVTSVILSLSGCHWKRVYPTIWGRALTRQGQALAQVNSLLSRSDRQSIFEACTTVLLLCLTELCDGQSKAWKWHLKAAGAILKSPAMRSLVSTDEWTFCISLFHYLDSMSTISRCKPPLLHEGDSMTELSSSLRRSSVPELTHSHSTDAIYGISPVLFDYLGMVNILANHRSRRVDELSEIGFRASAIHLENRINEWRVEHDRIDTIDGRELDTERATTAFEWAIRLRLHQIVEGYDPFHEIVEGAVTTILDAVREIPYASKVEGCLLFPLVIAGASSISVERRMVVKERLMVLESTLGFSHIQYARQLLEAVWKSGSTSGLNWAAVRYNQFPGVVFI
ncbi:hypothetical protein N7510_011757 [Penicillium lagena]|uniref:uncharacterized protein n=1 Tax=Penicillium lagena TaxID=94218 RepID=UPI00253FD206|nr:uncharacterized protein N7510_011757 [Penicillium lagena]KAJ5602223.1 hypothetical protein N7510_011757 [Penicillium lagena]